MKTIVGQWLIIMMIFLSPDHLVAQSADKPVSVEQRKKELVKKEEQRKAEEKAAVEEAKKQHMKLQDKKTRRRMKRSKRHAKRINDHKKTGFLKRLFTK